MLHAAKGPGTPPGPGGGEDRGDTPGRRLLFGAALLATLALLLLHASVYRFLTDDAYIGFRYVQNLVAGHGLVFNPGERVEGYTNFLWLLILAGARRVFGVAPETVANPLLIVATIGFWAVVAREALRAGGANEPRWPALVPLTLLALTRSVAVWSTSGLETRLFELLVVAAAFRLLLEIRESTLQGRAPAPVSGALFALASLTRPDAILIGGSAMFVACLWERPQRHAARRTWMVRALLFAVPVALHFAWRHAYYGDWLPNTWYQKVDGAWWDMGGLYLASFALEYGALLWLPLLALGVFRHRQRQTLIVPLVYAAVVLPHALYVASIGGDHFEYRALDLYLPFIFLLMGDGVREVRARVLRRKEPRFAACAAAGYGALLVLALVWIPWQSHRQYPSRFIPGFPGVRSGEPETVYFLDPTRDPLLRWPGLRQVAALHRRILYETTSRLVGIRAEEHDLFAEAVDRTGTRLRRMVESGLLPPDTHIATDAAGVIPYRSRLRTLDRLGLTNRDVARTPVAERRTMAHDHHATFEYGTRQGVDLWAVDPVHPVFTLDEERLAVLLDAAVRAGRDLYFASVDDAVLLVQLPRGVEATRRRLPALHLHSLLADSAAVGELRARIEEARASRLARNPTSTEARIASAMALADRGDTLGAIRMLEDLTSTEDPWVFDRLARLHDATGQPDRAVEYLGLAVAAAPDHAALQFNYGVGLGNVGRWSEARAALQRAAELEPFDPATRMQLGGACYLLGDHDCLTRQIQALGEIGTEQGLRGQENLRRLLESVPVP